MGFYDDDNFGMNQVIHLFLDDDRAAGANAAAEEVARVQWFNRARIIQCRAIVCGTAYDEGDCSFTLKVDTTSFGSVDVSTATVAQVVDSTFAAQVIEGTEVLVIEQASATSTGLCDFLIQYQELFE